MVMEGGIQEQKGGVFCGNSILLELSAADDLDGFRCAVEDKGFDVDGSSFWYSRRFGSKKMGLEERTPLMIASMYGSTEVLKYIIGTGNVDINRACGSDGSTALHSAAAGGSASSVEVVKLLLDASADANSVDVNGNKPGDLIAPHLKSSSNLKRKTLEMLLKGNSTIGEEEALSSVSIEKKEYPVDVSLPDINNGMYVTDEFRMYSFKVKPCSRAYSHDWTECPFVHPGENARRRDPRKYSYSCVPCPEFRKGTCVKSDACEYAHGVFESWLHPAQYRTRLCKDETGCSRKVCFFAHRHVELRPLYASTGSAMPSPKSVDMATLSPLALGSSSPPPPPPMSPSAACSSPMAGTMWQNKANLTPPMLQLPGSRLKTASSARDLELEMELLVLESLHTQQQQRQQLMDEMCGLSSPSHWNKEYSNRIGELKPTNLDDVFGSLDPSLLSQLQSRQNLNQLRVSYPTNLSSSPARKPSEYGFDSSRAVAAAVMNSRSAAAAAFTKRSQSFIDRGAAPVSHRPGLTAAANSASLMSSNLSGWSSPDGKLDWGFRGEELNKLKKSSSFGFRSGCPTTKTAMELSSSAFDEPDVSWVHPLVKDVSSVRAGIYSSEQRHGGVREMLPPWLEQLYIEQEQMVA
uniref:Putative zinc finger CCCH domain-containing protein 29-like n=1 Tax=Davidia involucrata TaxID=16924 RepID=A0A5B7AQ20_DAVIN